MANTGLLHDWLWFWQNGGSTSAKNPSTVNRTSRANLTVKEAKDNYRINRDLISGLADSRMIAHDAIEFLLETSFNGPVLTFDWVIAKPTTTSSYYSIYAYFGGEFTKVNGLECNYLTCFVWDLATSSSPNYIHISSYGGSGFDAPVKALKIHRNTNYSDTNTLATHYNLYVGGEFTKYNGNVVGYLVQLGLTTGTCDSRFIGDKACLNGPVYAIEKHLDGDHNIFIGGKFTKMWSSERLYFAQLYSDGPVFGVNILDGPIHAIKFMVRPSGGYLLAIGGEFTGTDVHGNKFQNFVISELDLKNFNKIWPTGHNSSNYWNSIVVDGPVYAVETFDNGSPYNLDGSGPRMRASIMIGGEFKTVNDEPCQNLAILGPFAYRVHTGYNPAKYTLDVDGPVYAIYTRDTRVVHIGGSFNLVAFTSDKIPANNINLRANNFFTFYPDYPVKAEAETDLNRSFKVSRINSENIGFNQGKVFALGSFYVSGYTTDVGIFGELLYSQNDYPIRHGSITSAAPNATSSDYYNYELKPIDYFLWLFRYTE